MVKQAYFEDARRYYTGLDVCFMILANSINWQDINPGRKPKTHESPDFIDIISSSIDDNQVTSTFDYLDWETTPSGSVSSPRKRPTRMKLAKHNKFKYKFKILIMQNKSIY